MTDKPLDLPEAPIEMILSVPRDGGPPQFVPKHVSPVVFDPDEPEVTQIKMGLKRIHDEECRVTSSAIEEALSRRAEEYMEEMFIRGDTGGGEEIV